MKPRQKKLRQKRAPEPADESADDSANESANEPANEEETPAPKQNEPKIPKPQSTLTRAFPAVKQFNAPASTGGGASASSANPADLAAANTLMDIDGDRGSPDIPSADVTSIAVTAPKRRGRKETVDPPPPAPTPAWVDDHSTWQQRLGAFRKGFNAKKVKMDEILEECRTLGLVVPPRVKKSFSTKADFLAYYNSAYATATLNANREADPPKIAIGPSAPSRSSASFIGTTFASSNLRALASDLDGDEDPEDSPLSLPASPLIPSAKLTPGPSRSASSGAASSGAASSRPSLKRSMSPKAAEGTYPFFSISLVCSDNSLGPEKPAKQARNAGQYNDDT